MHSCIYTQKRRATGIIVSMHSMPHFCQEGAEPLGAQPCRDLRLGAAPVRERDSHCGAPGIRDAYDAGAAIIASGNFTSPSRSSGDRLRVNVVRSITRTSARRVSVVSSTLARWARRENCITRKPLGARIVSYKFVSAWPVLRIWCCWFLSTTRRWVEVGLVEL